MTLTFALRHVSLALLLSLLLALGVGSLASPAVSAQEGETFSLLPRWFHVTGKPGELLGFPATAENKGSDPIDFTLEWVEVPGPEWGLEIRGAGTSYGVRGVSMTPEETRSLTIEITVPEGASSGDYTFVLRAVTVDGRLERSLPLTVTVEAEQASRRFEPVGKVELDSPRFSALTGTNDNTFEFPIVLRNRTSDPVNLDLGALAPSGWNVGFAPAFTKGKRITSVSIEAGSGETVSVEVSPPSNSDPGRYRIQFTATGESVDLSTEFLVEVTGRSELRIGLPTGRLNAKAEAGDKTPVTIQVSNAGTVPFNIVSLINQAPEGWEVSFKPASVTSLGQGEVREVVAEVHPPENTIPGDYRITLVSVSGGVVDSVDMLVTVTQSTIWGWAGLGIVILVLSGLVGLFVWLGRR